MKKSNEGKALVIRLDMYWEYADIIEDLTGDQDISLTDASRSQLRKLCEQGFTFQLYTQWLADDFDDYEPYRYCAHAANLLIIYAKKQCQALSVAQLKATEMPRQRALGYKKRNRKINARA